MKIKPYSTAQWQEFDSRTLELSMAGKGAWIAILMRLQSQQEYTMALAEAQWLRFLRCSLTEFRDVLQEFTLSKSCGLRVEYPPGYGEITDQLRVIYEPDEKVVLFLKSESLRVSKYTECKKKKERKRMPENWNLSESMREVAKSYGMITATIEHEFAHCKLHHAESLFTDRGWTDKVWQTWVLNWVKFGRKQVMVNGSVDRPPPYPPKNDPIARGMWSKAYGDPAKWGY